MSEAPLPNSQEARSPTGEILPPKIEETPSPSPNPEPTPKADGEVELDALGQPVVKADDKAKDDKAKADAKAKEPKAGAPEKYEFKVPDGFSLDPKVDEKVQTKFKAMNLSQEQGQELLDLYIEETRAASEAPYKAYNEMREGWLKQVKADPEIGDKLPVIKQSIGRLYDAIGNPALVADFKAAMNLTGAGDNPAFIKMLNTLAGALGEGKFVKPGNVSSGGQGREAAKPTPAAALYPNLPTSSRS